MQGQAQRRAIAGRWMVGAGGLAAAVALAVSGCAGSSDVSPSTTAAAARTTGLRDIPAPAVTTPEGVAVAALREIYTWHPAQEKPGDSFRRARQWLGPSLIRVADGTGPAAASALTSSPGPTTSPSMASASSSAAASPAVPMTPPPSLRWSEWAAAGAIVEAFAFASGEVPTDTDPNRVLRKIGIEQTVVYRDRREQLPSNTVIATLVKTDAGWRLDSYQ